MIAGTSSGYSNDTEIKADDTEGVVDFEHSLDDYVPAKNRYNFYFTYKIVHQWWDAVALGMEDVQQKYREKGIVITYEYIAPDAAPDCKRIAYVGNTHNYQDRANGAKDTIAKYKNMEIVAVEYDQDSIDLAYDLAKQMLEDNPDIAGFVCCNMSNPVGTA